MKVAILTDTFLPQLNGVVTCILELVHALKGKIEFSIFCPSKRRGMELKDGIRIYRFKSHEFKQYKEYYILNPMEMDKVKFMLEMEDPDIIHSHTPFLMGIAGLWFNKKAKKPFIGTFHTYVEGYLAHITKFKLEKVVKLFLAGPSWEYVKRFYNSCTLTTTPTHIIARELRKHGIKRVKVIPNPINLDAFRKKLKPLEKKGFTFLYLGRVSYEKRVDLLLDAFKQVEDAFLWIAGTGPALEKLKSKVKEEGIKNVKFFGRVSERMKIRLYQSCDCFVNPCDCEVQAITFLEAMACGKPCIGSNKLGSSEVIKHRWNGLKFKAGDANDLARKMKLIMQDDGLRDGLSKNALKYVERFDVKKVAREFEQLYKSLI